MLDDPQYRAREKIVLDVKVARHIAHNTLGCADRDGGVVGAIALMVRELRRDNMTAYIQLLASCGLKEGGL